MSRREQIRMTGDEVAEFLGGRRTMNVATVGPDGWPHVVAMWYGMDGPDPVFWTYGRSQKVVNLRRDPRITCLVEAGERYEELRGVELAGRAEIVEDRSEVLAIGIKVFERYTGPYEESMRPVVEQVGAKRVGVRVRVERVVSWDHSKLGGRY